MTVNKELLQLTLKTIKENPEHWNQALWHCGTTHCFAGFVEYLTKDISLDTDISDKIETEDLMKYSFWTNTREFSRKKLGISDRDADILFHSKNSLETLEYYVNQLCTIGNLDDEINPLD